MGELYAEKVQTRGLCAIAQAESLRYKLIGGLAVRRACYGVLRFIMESGAKGCEVVVSGKLRGQRAKSMKFVDGLMIHSGDPVNDYVDSACRHVLLRQGVLGIKVKIIIMATRTQNVLGEKGRRIRELTSVVQKRFNFPEGTVELYAEKVQTRGLCAIAQAESLRYKLIGGLAVRRACYGVLRFIMESGAKGCEVVVSGKLRGQRARSMKFVDGLMILSG